MRKSALILVMALMSLVSYAQQDAATAPMKFGFLSYDSVMVSMPEYVQVQTNLTQLRTQYEAEQQRVADEFNRKYEEFLDGQRSYPKTILQKRQSELQEMLDKNIAFKKESQRLLAEAETKQYQTLRTRIQGAVETVAKAQNLCFVLNTDTGAFTWVSAEKGEDITEAVKQLLK